MSDLHTQFTEFITPVQYTAQVKRVFIDFVYEDKLVCLCFYDSLHCSRTKRYVPYGTERYMELYLGKYSLKDDTVLRNIVRDYLQSTLTKV